MIALPSTKSSPKTRVWEQLCSQGSSYLERAKRPQCRALVLRLLLVPMPGSKTHLSWTEFPPKTVWSHSLGFILIVNKASFSSNSDSLLSHCMAVGTLGHLCWGPQLTMKYILALPSGLPERLVILLLLHSNYTESSTQRKVSTI